MMLGWCARRNLSAHDAADITSDVFVAALMSRYTYDPTVHATAEWWLRGIAFNVVAGEYREALREHAAQARLRNGALLEESDVAEYAALREELSETIKEIGDLPVEQRSAPIARRLDDMDYADMAKAAGVSQQVIRARVSRAVKSLKKRMDEEK